MFFTNRKAKLTGRYIYTSKLISTKAFNMHLIEEFPTYKIVNSMFSIGMFSKRKENNIEWYQIETGKFIKVSNVNIINCLDETGRKQFSNRIKAEAEVQQMEKIICEQLY